MITTMDLGGWTLTESELGHIGPFEAVEHLTAVLAGEEHLRRAYDVRNAVT